MGTVTKTIGSSGGRDFSTIALWEASLPANLVTDGNSYVGQCFNDSEFAVAGNVVTISGHTTDATHTITLTTGAGQSFADNVNAQTNALKYNAANGVGLRQTSAGAGGGTVIIGDANVFLSKLQISNDSTFSAGSCIAPTGSGSFRVDGSILQDTSGNIQGPILNNTTGAPILFANCLLIQDATAYPPSSFGISAQGGNLILANCTLVMPSDDALGATAIKAFGHSYNGGVKCVNCAVFGWGAISDTTDGSVFGNNCATDNSAFPGSGFTSSLVSKTYTSQFVGTLLAAQDYRAKSGGDLIDASSTDTTDIPGATDIVGTSRPQGSAWDIGAWELQATDVLMPQICM